MELHAAHSRRRRLALRWSLALNLALVLAAVALALGWAAQRATGPGRPPLQRMRADHLHELAGRPGSAEVVLLGDSLTQYAEWSELLGRAVTNRGVAGDRVEDVRRRVADLAPLRPRTLLLMVGVNDLARGASPDEVARAHAALVGELRAALPSTRIVVQSILPVRSPRGHLAAPIARTNELLRRASREEGVEWFEVGRHLAEPSGALAARYSMDGLHLTGEGYRAWADALAPVLSGVQERPPRPRVGPSRRTPRRLAAGASRGLCGGGARPGLADFTGRRAGRPAGAPGSPPAASPRGAPGSRSG